MTKQPRPFWNYGLDPNWRAWSPSPNCPDTWKDDANQKTTHAERREINRGAKKHRTRKNHNGK